MRSLRISFGGSFLNNSRQRPNISGLLKRSSSCRRFVFRDFDMKTLPHRVNTISALFARKIKSKRSRSRVYLLDLIIHNNLVIKAWQNRTEGMTEDVGTEWKNCFQRSHNAALLMVGKVARRFS